MIREFDIPSIQRKFLVVGHTQNEGDAMHSRIEYENKRALKSGPIYVPSQVCTISSLAKRTGKPYIVRQMETNDFIDCKSLCNDIGNNFSVNEEGEKVSWNAFTEIMV